MGYDLMEENPTYPKETNKEMEYITFEQLKKVTLKKQKKE